MYRTISVSRVNGNVMCKKMSEGLNVKLLNCCLIRVYFKQLYTYFVQSGCHSLLSVHYASYYTEINVVCVVSSGLTDSQARKAK